MVVTCACHFISTKDRIHGKRKKKKNRNTCRFIMWKDMGVPTRRKGRHAFFFSTSHAITKTAEARAASLDLESRSSTSAQFVSGSTLHTCPCHTPTSAATSTRLGKTGAQLWWSAESDSQPVVQSVQRMTCRHGFAQIDTRRRISKHNAPCYTPRCVHFVRTRTCQQRGDANISCRAGRSSPSNKSCHGLEHNEDTCPLHHDSPFVLLFSGCSTHTCA